MKTSSHSPINLPPDIFALENLTIEDYLAIVQHPDLADRRIELVDGRLVEKGESPYMVSSNRNSYLAMEIGALMVNAAKPTRAGRVTGADGGYRLADGHVRQPDVAFIRYERLSPENPIVVDGGPDIAVEVISPSEKAAAVVSKAQAYLEAGSTLVWAVYDDEKVVHEYRLSAVGKLEVGIFGIDDTLTAPDVLPTLQINLRELFSE